MSTTENLKAAFSGESQANRRYLAFAKKAEAEGFAVVARLFRAIAEAETVHAHAHLKALGEIRSTLENLKTAQSGEAYEYQEMYPPFLVQAEKDGQRAAATSFRYALAVEETHHELYTKAIEAVGQGQDLPDAAVYVCDVCGHTVMDEAPDRCPVCGAPKKRFQEFN